MRRWFAMSAIGRDRPGIVADLADLIYDCDCNLEDSRMTILGSEFAVLLLLSGQGDDLERRLSSGSKRLEWEKRLTVFIRPLDEPTSSTCTPTSAPSPSRGRRCTRCGCGWWCRPIATSARCGRRSSVSRPSCGWT
jgi:predicted amino acid-binding ACT domain protein